MKQTQYSVISLLFSLTSGHLSPNAIWKKTAYRIKFLLRSLFIYTQTIPLLKSLVKLPNLNQILQAQPSLPCKLHRPYLAVNLAQRHTRLVLEAHYHYFLSHFPPALREGILSAQRYKLAEITGKNDEMISVYIMSDDRCNREGEITLYVQNADDITLAKMTFTLMCFQDSMCLFIGGCQGANQHVDHALIQQATKVCHGLFPKRIALESLRSLGRCLRLDHIIAVGDRTHIYNNWRYRLKRKQMHASYNEFWLSQEGQEDISGYFHLPLTGQQKSIEEIASKKRAEYRRRYALLGQLDQAIKQHFDSIASNENEHDETNRLTADDTTRQLRQASRNWWN